MKIAIDIRALSTGKRTGMEEYLLALLNALFEIDKENQYILFNNNFNKNNFHRENLKIGENVRFADFGIPNKIFNSSLAFLNFPKLDKICGNPDIFFSPCWNFCKLSNKIKYVLTVHDLSFEASKDFFSFKRRLWHKFIQTKNQVNRADKIIAVSESTKIDLIDLYNASPEKIKVIYSGINKQFFEEFSEEEKSRVIKKYNLPEKFILFVGTIEPRKGILNLIKAFEEFKKSNKTGIDLVIAGIKGWSCGEILKTIKKSSQKENIYLPGFIEDADKPVLMQTSKLFAYPSFYEGFGFPPLEAMACSVPVITSHNPSLSEIASGGSLMINPWNLDEFSWAINECLNNFQLREKMIKNGREHAGKFQWMEVARKTLEIIKN